MKTLATPAPLALAGALTLSLAAASDTTSTIGLARFAVCGAAVFAAAWYDLRERRIPNRLVLPAAATCVGLAAADRVRVSAFLLGLALVAGLLVLSLARPEALGMGDVKLALLIAVGLDAHAAVAFAAAVALAALVGLMLILRLGTGAMRRSLPLAPFLAAGALLATLA
jgi:leader peptidase (prepilin peptidase)/N-methyltransferase